MRQIAVLPISVAAALILAPHTLADPATQAVQLANISYPHCAIQADRVFCLGGTGRHQKVEFLLQSGDFQWDGGSSLSGGRPIPLTPGQTYH